MTFIAENRAMFAAAEALGRLLAAWGVAPGAVEIGAGHGCRFKTALVRAPARIPPDLGITPARA